MKEYNQGLCLEQEILITIPLRRFDQAFKKFKQRARGSRLRNKNWFSYSINSDGKFRLELKENPNDEHYIFRISGWKKGSPKKPNIEIRKLYTAEQGDIKLYPWVYDFIDLLEEWAVKYKGYFYLKYIDFNMPILDSYCIINGLEKHKDNSDWELRDLLSLYGFSEIS